MTNENKKTSYQLISVHIFRKKYFKDNLENFMSESLNATSTPLTLKNYFSTSAQVINKQCSINLLHWSEFIWTYWFRNCVLITDLSNFPKNEIKAIRIKILSKFNLMRIKVQFWPWSYQIIRNNLIAKIYIDRCKLWVWSRH